MSDVNEGEADSESDDVSESIIFDPIELFGVIARENGWQVYESDETDNVVGIEINYQNKAFPG